MKWQLLLSLCVALSRVGAYDDVDEKLSAETTADDAASSMAACWCHEYEEELDSRGRDIEFALRHAEQDKNVAHFGNVKLRLEIDEHSKEISQHQQSLDSGAAIKGKSQSAYEEERQFHQAAIDSIHKAIDVIPAGSGGEVRGTLQSLKQTFADKMSESEAQHNSSFRGVLDAKAEMLRLAKEGADMKSKRLQEGLSTVEAADHRITAFTAQESSDASVRSSLTTLCDGLSSEAAERTRLRQQAAIVVSQAKADQAAAAAHQAYSKMSFLRGSSKVNVTIHASSHAQATSLEAMLARGKDVEAKVTKMLSMVRLDAQLIGATGGETAKVKAAIADLGKKADANLQAFPSLFAAVRTSGQKSAIVDQQYASEFAK